MQLQWRNNGVDMQGEFVVESEAISPLDLFSTSPTQEDFVLSHSPSLRCDFHAPFFAYQEGGSRYGVVQGCCNHWECRRCGVLVAKQHYGRIVEGARQIAKDCPLWFITITCRGEGLSEADATKNYLVWTSKFLDRAYADAKRKGKRWEYVQVTEKQKRGHPHSHILTTFYPNDVVEGAKENWYQNASGARVHEWVDALRSEWLLEASVSAGLGEQYDLSVVENIEAASRYVAKYMFKDSQFSTHFPKGWKRVRYSQSWPKLAREKSDAFVLLSADDWRYLATLASVVDAADGEAYEQAEWNLRGSDTLVHRRKAEIVDKSIVDKSSNFGVT